MCLPHVPSAACISTTRDDPTRRPPSAHRHWSDLCPLPLHPSFLRRAAVPDCSPATKCASWLSSEVCSLCCLLMWWWHAAWMMMWAAAPCPSPSAAATMTARVYLKVGSRASTAVLPRALSQSYGSGKAPQHTAMLFYVSLPLVLSLCATVSLSAAILVASIWHHPHGCFAVWRIYE